LVDFSTEKAVSDIIEDVYSYADTPSQNKIIGKLEKSCSAILSTDDSFATIMDICKDNDTLSKIRENCDIYYGMRADNRIQVNNDLEESCRTVLSGDIEKSCEKLKDAPEINSTHLAVLCEEHENDIITDKEFFKSFAMQNTYVPESKVDSFFANKMIILPLSIFAACLLVLLFILHKENFNGLNFSIGRILFNLGIMLLLASSTLYLYNLIRNPDTSIILGSMTDIESSPGMIGAALPILIPLILSRIFTTPLIVIGIIFLFSGITLKVIFKSGRI